MATTAAQLEVHLNALLENGRIEVGLEVGADPGLPAANYVQLPAVMRVGSKASKPTGPRTAATDAKGKSSSPPASPVPVVVPDWVMFHEEKVFGAASVDGYTFTKGAELHNFKPGKPASWDTEIRAFVAANKNAVRADEFDEATVQKVHAIRYWAVKAGLVATAKSREYTECADPSAADMQAVSTELVQFISNYSGQALTACVARTASWRKTNHATGGGNDGMATGLPRRWMTKEQMWSNDNDRARAGESNKKFTTAFYIATHAVSVHSVLALIAPDNKHHFAVVKSAYGAFRDWDARESVKLRLTPSTQVAGAAMVTDSVEVVKMLITEGFTPMLTNESSLQHLHRAYGTVRDNGMLVGVYASWFFDGHPDPDNHKRVEFNQKDSGFSALIGELGVVATKFYRGTTIGQSPALANAASQMASSADQNKWGQLARFREGSSSIAMLKAFGRVTGAGSSAITDDLAADDDAKVTDAVDKYSKIVSAHAALYDVTNFAVPTVDKVKANAKTSDTRAEEVSKLGI